jgi:hypothetical protein
MRKLSRRELILLGAMAVALAVYATRPGADASLPPLKAPDGKAEAARPAGEAPVIQLALLSPNDEGYDGRGRDLFQYSQRPPSAAELARRAAEAREQERLRQEAEKRARELAEIERQRQLEYAKAHANDPPPPPPRPVPPPVTVKYLGTMGPRNDRIAFFDHNKELIMAKEGDVFLRDFRVVKIGYETVTVGFTRPEFKSETREVPMTRSGR